MKHVSIFTFLLFLSLSAFGQELPYNITTDQGTYVALDAATSTVVSPGEAWDDPFAADLLPFPFEFMGEDMDSFLLIESLMLWKVKNKEILMAFDGYSSDLFDRGYPNNTLSSILYRVDGMDGDRIFKIEIANAGFYDEMDILGTMEDFTNVQFWFFENSFDIEVHYGPNMVVNDSVSHGEEGLSVAFVRATTFGDTFEEAFFLGMNPLAPTVGVFTDSVPPDASFEGFDNDPSDGTIIRFSPKTSPVKDVKGQLSWNIYPSMTSKFLNIERESSLPFKAEIIDLSGRQMKVYENYTKNIFDVSFLNGGYYILKLETEGQSQSVQFYKN